MIAIELLEAAIKPANDAETAYIEELELAAVAYIERQAGRYYGPVRDRTEVVIGGGRGALFLEGPVAPDVYDNGVITSVNEAAYPGADLTEIVQDADDGFVLRDDALYRIGGGAWLRGYEYEIAYEQGYYAGEEPADIRQAVMQLVTLWFSVRLPVALGTVAPEVPHGVQAVIDANRRMRV